MPLSKSAFIASILMLPASALHAGLDICNKTKFVQAVSIGYKSGDNWVSEGWWNVDPGACSTVVRGDLKNRYYYYRSEINGGDFDGGGYMFCTSPQEYTIVGDEDCDPRGYDREDFSQIDTGPKATSFTLNLVP